MRVRIHRFSVAVSMVLLAAFLSSCASGPRIIANRAPDFSLVDFQTFGFLQPLSTDRGTTRTLLSTSLIEKTTRELEFAGLRHDQNNPDLLINFFVSTRETLQTRPSTSASIHHSRGRYNTWGGYSWGVSTTEVVQRTEGTLAVDIINRATNTLVWEGAATQRITDSVRQDPDPVIDRAISDLFAQFP